MRVKNRKGSGDERCSPCGSWIKHWEKGTGQQKSICGVFGCNNRSVIGGHVIKVAGTDKASYITPICDECNRRTDEFDVLWDLYPAISTRCWL